MGGWVSPREGNRTQPAGWLPLCWLVTAMDWERTGLAGFCSLESAPKRDGNCSLPVLPAAGQNVGPNWHSQMTSHREGGVSQHETGRGIMRERRCFPRSHLDVSGGGEERLRPSALDDYISKPSLTTEGLARFPQPECELVIDC